MSQNTDDKKPYGPTGKPIDKPKLRMGEVLRADAYDQKGVLLLRAGKTVEEASWINRLAYKDVKFVQNRKANPVTENSQPGVQSTPTTNMEDESRTDVVLVDAVKLEERAKRADVVRNETVASVASVFGRLGKEKRVDVNEVRSAVSSMMDSLMQDKRALLSLTSIKDADNYTYVHSVNVSVLAMCLAIQLGYEADLENIGIGGLMHDVGKTETPLDILHKPGPLNNGEAHVIKQHPVVGARILIASGGFSPISVVCTRDHHESMDGKGYPAARKGSDISPYAQIISVADVYDALTTDRPYREALSPKQALILMSRKFADSFNPGFLSAFISLVSYYPVGSIVHLSNGYEAVVLLNDPADPTKPALVKTVKHPDGRAVENSQTIDLRIHSHLLDLQSAKNDQIVEDATPIVMREISGFSAVA